MATARVRLRFSSVLLTMSAGRWPESSWPTLGPKSYQCMLPLSAGGTLVLPYRLLTKRRSSAISSGVCLTSPKSVWLSVRTWWMKNAAAVAAADIA